MRRLIAGVFLAASLVFASPAVAQVNVTPCPECLPGTSDVARLIGGLASWALLGAVAAIIVGAAAWALSSRAGHGGGVAGGRVAVITGFIAAVIIGAASMIVNFGFGVGRGAG